MTDIWQAASGIRTRASHWLIFSVEGRGGCFGTRYIKHWRPRCPLSTGINQKGLAGEQQMPVGSCPLRRKQI